MAKKRNRLDERQFSLPFVHIRQEIKRQVVNFGSSESSESKTNPQTVKLTDSQKTALHSFSDATGISQSKIISDALKLYFQFFDKLPKVIRYTDAVTSMLDSLP